LSRRGPGQPRPWRRACPRPPAPLIDSGTDRFTLRSETRFCPGFPSHPHVRPSVRPSVGAERLSDFHLLKQRPGSRRNLSSQDGANKAGITREQFPRSILVTSSSQKCHEEIGRVGRGCYEDVSDLSVTSRACRARRLWRTTRHTDNKRLALYTAADRRPTNQISAWQAERGSRPTRPTRTSARLPRRILARM